MKRTPVLIDVNGVPLRESLSYNGGGAGFGGQMAEWCPQVLLRQLSCSCTRSSLARRCSGPSIRMVS